MRNKSIITHLQEGSWLICKHSTLRGTPLSGTLPPSIVGCAYKSVISLLEVLYRLKEHKRALTSGNPAQSAVAEHAMEEMHAIDWEKAQVVDSHPHYTQ